MASKEPAHAHESEKLTKSEADPINAPQWEPLHFQMDPSAPRNKGYQNEIGRGTRPENKKPAQEGRAVKGAKTSRPRRRRGREPPSSRGGKEAVE
jgi:hypothetical protein